MPVFAGMVQAGISERYFTLPCNLHLSLYDVVCGIMERVRRQAPLSGGDSLMFSVFLHAIRMTLRDWRAGEWRFLLVAMTVAVAALSSVSFFIDRMHASLREEAAVLLGADMVIVSDRAFGQAWFDEAARLGLSLAQTRQFPTMALPDGDGDAAPRLVSLKAVSDGYPLRGALQLSGETDNRVFEAEGIPENGTVWVDKALLAESGIGIGESIQLGNGRYRVARAIVSEPDRGISWVSLAPRVMMSLRDLEKTGLVQPASRVSFRMLLSGSADGIGRFKQWADERIAGENLRGMRIETVENNRPEMKTTLNRAQQFLALVGLLSAVLAAVAIAMGARRFVNRHMDTCAILRCLGMTAKQVMLVYLIGFFLVGLAGCLIGLAAGYGGHLVLAAILRTVLPQPMVPAGWMTMAKCLFIGMSLLLGFALPPICSLQRVPVIRVIRRDAGNAAMSGAWTYIPGMGVFAGLLCWLTGEWRMGLWMLGGFLASAAVMALSGWCAIRALAFARVHMQQGSLRFCLSVLERKPLTTVVQIVALSVGLMAMLLLAVVRNDLIGAWQDALPPDTPNHFVVNILPEQKEAVRDRLVQAGVTPPVLYPMIRGRLTSVNGKAVSSRDYEDSRAKRLVEREFNLSCMTELPPQNRIVEGDWFGSRRAEASLEERLAKTLGIKMGDRLVFDVTGMPVEATVTSLRKLDWSSARVNFFVIMHPADMQDMPATWITSFYADAAQKNAVGQMVHAFPNLTVIDIGYIVAQVRTMLDRITLAVEFLFLFTLASGVLVLHAALVGTQEERMHEASILRTLGATRKELRRMQRIELVFIGAMSGLLAATGASLAGWVLAVRFLELDWTFNPLVWVYGVAGGVVCACVGGWLGLRKVLNTPPVQSLRRLS